MTSATILVVVPAYNEARSIGTVVSQLRDSDYDTLVIDDGSTDDTGSIAASAGARVVRLPVNLGVGGALRCGFKYAAEHRYAAVVQCDADGQHAPENIADLINAQERTGSHLVIGSRFGDGNWVEAGRARRTAMRVLASAASRATGVRLTDATSGFRLVVDPLLSAFAREFPTNYLGDTFEAVVSAGRAGYRVTEVPVPMHARSHGRSSASPMAATKFLVRSVIVAATGLHFPIDAYSPTIGPS